MNDTALRLALREVQRLLSTPVFWALAGVIALVLGLSGPFGTYASMGLAPRLAYWAAIVVATGLAGWLAGTWVVLAFELRDWPFWAEAIAAGAVVGGVVSAVVHLINAAVLDTPLLSWQALVQQAPATPLIGLAVTATIIWTSRRAALPFFAAPEAPAAPPGPPAARLMARLPLDKRGALVALSVQDHYTEIVTTKGRELLLLRLSDAMAEAEGVPGLQVHRSHWVALSAVARARRGGARAVLTLKDGREVPVSRSFLPDVKRAGLL